MTDFWWPYWYFHLPNYGFAVLFYTLFGRFLLGLVLPPDSPNYVFRWFCRLTDWFMAPVAWITPRAFPTVVLAPIAAYWVVVLRIAFFVVLHSAGLAPSIAPQGG